MRFWCTALICNLVNYVSIIFNDAENLLAIIQPRHVIECDHELRIVSVFNSVEVNH